MRKKFAPTRKSEGEGGDTLMTRFVVINACEFAVVLLFGSVLLWFLPLCYPELLVSVVLSFCNTRVVVRLR